MAATESPKEISPQSAGLTLPPGQAQEPVRPTAEEIGAAVAKSGIGLGDLVEYDSRTVQFPEGPQRVPAGRGPVRDVFAGRGEIVVRVELEGGGSDAPPLDMLRAAVTTRAGTGARIEANADAYRVDVLDTDGTTLLGSLDAGQAEARGIIASAKGPVTMDDAGVITAALVPFYVGSATHRLTPLPTEERVSHAALSPHEEEPRAPRMVATCCSCGAGIEMPMDGPRPACTHDGEIRPDGGIVIAGTVVRPAGPGTCYTDRHIVRDVPRWKSGNYVPRCGECVAAGLGVSVASLPGFTEDRAALPTSLLTAVEVEEFPAADGCANHDDDGCTDHRYKIHFEKEGAFDSYDDASDARDGLDVLVGRHNADNEGGDCEGCGSPGTEHGYWIQDTWPPTGPGDRI